MEDSGAVLVRGVCHRSILYTNALAAPRTWALGQCFSHMVVSCCSEAMLALIIDGGAATAAKLPDSMHTPISRKPASPIAELLVSFLF